MTLRSRLSPRRLAACLLPLLWLAAAAPAQQLETLVDVEGIRENQLTGYGIVVGLSGSGDGTQARYTSQSLRNMLDQYGVRTPDGVQLRARNTAAVMISAVFPPGYRKGQTIDVVVSSIGDAKSLRGGTLLLAPLAGADGKVYALAQGNLVVPGLSAQGRSGSSVTINTPTAGRIPNGATIEEVIPSDFSTAPTIRLNLKRPDFRTATNITNALNRTLGEGAAYSLDATAVEVTAPPEPRQRVAFVARINALDVDSGNGEPRVVFNSRTGTVVISQDVKVKPVVISHGALRVMIGESPAVSQPNAFGGGQTATVPQSQVNVEQAVPHTFRWPAGASLQAIVDTINSIGATPDDMMAILQAMDEAGALTGKLVVI
ncbi:flagellar basal body P-ring protein FlgI [Xanthomonas campestris pv. phormiicola]|nr:flagellar basal body P-ring protein FlgI [Xanthomonas campestris pv. phormiicola]UYC17847.1 flagellar basal body P-ring protein FlgI [Xanthomonas campestris pv. phormiicola]